MKFSNASDFARAKTTNNAILYKDIIKCPTCSGLTNTRDLEDFGCCIQCDKQMLDI